MKTSPQRLLLGVEYLGTAYHGWQRQTSAPSVQGTLEKVLSEISAHPVSTICAGRTDAGVHATCQYIHFDCNHPRPEKAWLKGANTLLPDDVSVFSVNEVDDEFSARFTAVDRTYTYLIHNAPTPQATMSKTTTWINYPLNEKRMHQAVQAIIGEQNFSAFRSTHCQSHSVHRFVSEVSVSRLKDLVVFQITANAFLHHMVRNLVGSLIEVGKGAQDTNWMSDLITSEDRNLAGVTAPPNGLFLTRVRYPAEVGVSDEIRYPLYLDTNFTSG